MQDDKTKFLEEETFGQELMDETKKGITKMIFIPVNFPPLSAWTTKNQDLKDRVGDFHNEYFETGWNDFYGGIRKCGYKNDKKIISKTIISIYRNNVVSLKIDNSELLKEEENEKKLDIKLLVLGYIKKSILECAKLFYDEKDDKLEFRLKIEGLKGYAISGENKGYGEIYTIWPKDNLEIVLRTNFRAIQNDAPRKKGEESDSFSYDIIERLAQCFGRPDWNAIWN